MSVYVSVCPSVRPSVHFSVCIYIYICVCVSVRAFVHAAVCRCMSASGHACMHVCLVSCLSVPCVCVRTYIRMSVCMYLWLVSCLYVCLSRVHPMETVLRVPGESSGVN